MKLETLGAPHLTYCTNIHPGETWADVQHNLETYVAAVKARLSLNAPFGVGLRLSARAARELSAPGTLASFRAWLRANGLYVFTINGFPHGTFHGTCVKDAVYLPDWLDDARVDYTETLAALLTDLMPDDRSLYGSVSTVPGAYRSRIQSRSDVQAMASRLIRVAATLDALHARTGKVVILALEPEPSCHFETVDETVAFFENHLFASTAQHQFAALARCSLSVAETALRRHLGVCFDACHMAIVFEEAGSALERFDAAEITIGKFQITAGLEVNFSRASELAPLHAFANDVYLHQVVERNNGNLVRYLDLPNALDAAAQATSPQDRTWRIHFHVPIFRERLGPFAGTQPFLRDLLTQIRSRPESSHLEVETYTWDVLPEELRQDGILHDITRELEWARRELQP